MSQDWVHGIHGIRALLDTGIPGTLLAEHGQDRAQALVNAAGSKVGVQRVSRAELRKRTGNANARLAAFSADSGQPVQRTGSGASGSNRLPDADFDLSVLKNPAAGDLVFALDQVTDPHNLGAILRTANRFGVRAVIYPKRGNASDSDVVRRSSAGASEHQLHGAVVNLARSLRTLRDFGYWVYAAEATGNILWESSVTYPAVIVLGSEGRGLRPNVRSNCDASLSIPGGGFADSLNVSVAAGIFAYELKRRLDADSGSTR
ncbi:MAG: 23S rRNA (guanosine(2251)-2'-O)-methyltransferase RlmB [Spirochaetaceae bacterium]